MLEKLKEAVCEANLKLVEYGLVIMTWGNVSAISEDGRFVVIKPSGVDYSVMEPGMMTVVDMDGSIVEGELRPSSDLPTHLELYRSFAGVRSVVHTHSLWATSLAQAELDLPCYGTTHADTFHGSVPLHAGAHPAGDRRRVRAQHRQGHSRDLPRARHRPRGRARRARLQARALHLGRQHGKVCRERAGAGDHGAHGLRHPRLHPRRGPGPHRAAGQALLQKTRQKRLLRPEPSGVRQSTAREPSRAVFFLKYTCHFSRFIINYPYYHLQEQR